MISLIFAVVAGLAGGVLVERRAIPPGPLWPARRHALSAFVWRLALFLTFFAFFFALSWRPWFSAIATVMFVAVFVLISLAKVRFVREPLVFADAGFVFDVFRHPRLFASAWLVWAVPLATLSFALAIVLWWQIEAPLWPALAQGSARAIGILLWFATLAAAISPLLRPSLARAAIAIVGEPHLEHDSHRFGLLTAFTLHAFGWSGDDRARRNAQWESTAPAVQTRRPDPLPVTRIVVIQAESFIDLRRLRQPAVKLPNLDRARARAASWGRLATSFEGGYTVRTEMAFLVGRPIETFGFDQFNPYHNARPYGAAALPSRLRTLGYATTFIHPYYNDFFWRHRALPQLGFDRLVMLDAFKGASRRGGYVTDDAIADILLAEFAAPSPPQYIHAATIENHGPWEAGRFEGLRDPVDVYCAHLESADAMLGRVLNDLDCRPERSLVLFFGDHAPLLKVFADPFPDNRTDYVLIEVGQMARSRAGGGAGAPAPMIDRSVDELAGMLLANAGLLAPGHEPAP